MLNRARSLILLAGALLLGGCPRGHVCTDAPQRTGGQRMFLAMRVMDDKEQSGRRLMRRGGKAKSGERYDLKVDVEERAHVYVLRQRPGREMEPLWPAGVAAPVDPAMSLHIPVEGTLTIEGAPGVESLYVVVAPSPLSKEQVRTAAQRAPDARESGESNAVKRGPDAQEERAYGCAERDSILAMRFWFLHE